MKPNKTKNEDRQKQKEPRQKDARTPVGPVRRTQQGTIEDVPEEAAP